MLTSIPGGGPPRPNRTLFRQARRPMNLLCPNCQQQLSVGEQYAGQLMKCPLCNNNFTVPALPQTTAAPAPGGPEPAPAATSAPAGPAPAETYGFQPEPPAAPPP